jgi:4-amino-4-deoxy-L-arabinose transferase-like glycosyltransferase
LNSRTGTDWLLLAGFCAFLFFYGLGSFGLLGPDEPRYAQVAREMLERRDWIVPTLGGQTWLEKPPLFYWQAMLAYAVFGVSDWAARLPGALDATLLVLGIYLFLRRLRPGFELDGALITASTAAVVGFGRAASTDMPLATMFALAMLAWYAWSETSQKSYLAGFYVLLGLGTLAKGPIAPFLAGLVVVLFAIAAADSRIVLRSLWIPGIALFAAVALPWYVAIQVRRPEFFQEFILRQNLARFTTALYSHEQPFWFFLPILILGLIPWIVFTAAAIGETVRLWLSERKALFGTADAFSAFLILWLVIPVLFFSLSRAKLPGYILPAMPAAPLLLVEYLRRHVRGDKPCSAWLVGSHALVAAFPVVPALIIQYILRQRRLPLTTGTVMACVVAFLLALGIATTLLKSGLRWLRFVTLIPAVITVASVIRTSAPYLDSMFSARPVARELARMETTRLPLAVLAVKHDTEFGLAFYRNQRISRYDLHQIPPEDHLLVALQGSTDQGSLQSIRELVDSRKVVFLGSYAPQRLDYYWVGKSSN